MKFVKIRTFKKAKSERAFLKIRKLIYKIAHRLGYDIIASQDSRELYHTGAAGDPPHTHAILKHAWHYRLKKRRKRLKHGDLGKILEQQERDRFLRRRP